MRTDEMLKVQENHDALMAEIARLRAALEPFRVLATPSTDAAVRSPLYHVVQKILESAPYPDDLKAVNEFCNAVLGAREALA